MHHPSLHQSAGSVKRRQFIKTLAAASLLSHRTEGDWLTRLKSEMTGRAILDLTGPWKVQVDPFDGGSRVKYFSPSFSKWDWPEVSLPRTMNMCLPGMDGYRGICWFWRRVRLPAELLGKHGFLCFEGVNYYSSLWINGEKLLENKDPFLKFEARLPDSVLLSNEWDITIKVDNRRAKGELPTFEGWFPEGGVLREVWFETRPAVYLQQVAIRTPLDSADNVFAQVALMNQEMTAATVSLEMVVRGPDGQLAADVAMPPIVVDPGQSRVVVLAGSVPEVEVWSPALPKLYTADFKLNAGGEIDFRRERFGFRTIEACDGKLFLNGKQLFLTGFNRHEDSPDTGMAVDLATARKDFTEMKNAGCNFVRLCHYPHHPGELDLCDELGLMVLSEIPLNGWGVEGVNGSYGWDPEELRAIRQAAERQLRKMIARYFNHPSVILWSVCNEPDESRPEIVKTNSDLMELVRKLDGTRLVTHVSNHWTSAKERPIFQVDDVICINAYPSHRRLDEPGFDFEKAGQWLGEKLEDLHSLHPRKPILITEFGYPCLAGINGPVGEDTQAEAFEAEFRSMVQPYLCGAAVWCFADHPWPPGGYAGLAFNVSPYGFMTRDRRKLRAFAAAEKLFKERHKEKG